MVQYCRIVSKNRVPGRGVWDPVKQGVEIVRLLRLVSRGVMRMRPVGPSNQAVGPHRNQSPNFVADIGIMRGAVGAREVGGGDFHPTPPGLQETKQSLEARIVDAVLRRRPAEVVNHDINR